MQVLPWTQKVLSAAVKLHREDIVRINVNGKEYPVVRDETLKDIFSEFRTTHIFRLQSVPQAIKESADNHIDFSEAEKAKRALQYFSTSNLAGHILGNNPTFLGEEKGTRFYTNAEIYNVTRKTSTHCHGRTFGGSIFSLSYGGDTEGVESSGGLVVYLLDGSHIQKTPEFFVEDAVHDFYLKRKYWDEVPSAELPPTNPDDILIVHDGATAHSNMKVKLGNNAKRTIGFLEIVPEDRLDEKYLRILTSEELARQQRDDFIEGKVVGVLDSCPIV